MSDSLKSPATFEKFEVDLDPEMFDQDTIDFLNRWNDHYDGIVRDQQAQVAELTSHINRLTALCGRAREQVKSDRWLTDRDAYLLAAVICLGVPSYLAWRLSPGSVAFAIFGIVFSICGRQLGWKLSRASLYGDSMPVVMMEVVVWGALVAFAMNRLIVWQQPNVAVRWIFGFIVGAYVSFPNYGLFLESTIPPDVRPRHEIVSIVPFIAYIVCSILFVFLLGSVSLVTATN